MANDWCLSSSTSRFVLLSNFCHSAFCRAAHRSAVCQHLETLTNSDWSCTVPRAHTHIPEGARWGWKQEVVKFTPASVRTVIYPHQGQWQQMWQGKMKKGNEGVEGWGHRKEDSICCQHSYPRRNAFINTLSPNPPLGRSEAAVCLFSIPF